MCAICGKINFREATPVDRVLVQKMLGTMRHRGPDDEGFYFDGPVGLGHRRLSIIDLSSGHQPLSNEDGTIWIVFNGEIYNFHELRTYLIARGHTFRTQTDTEVIVHLYEEFGPDCLHKLRGMFAFAIWDESKKTLFLARDRVGIKPLYYSLKDESLIFGSEIKAILIDPDVNRQIRPEAIDRFITFRYLPGEETLQRGVNKLPPGHYLLAKNGRVNIKQYWDLQFAEPSGETTFEKAKEELLELLGETVGLHMIADVPIGVLLSGGVDSTAMLSFASEKTNEEVSSYTIGFTDCGVQDERPYARLASGRFGSRHHEMTISARDFATFMPDFVWHMEEPVCEPPAVALYYVSKLASQDVKVLLSGEGGDEAFAGYGNYRNLLWFERVKRIIHPIEKTATAGFHAASSLFRLPQLGRYGALLGAHFPDYYYSRTAIPSSIVGSGLDGLYTRDFAHSIDQAQVLAPIHRLHDKVRGLGVLNAMLYIDTKTWLPDDLLVKADKMTMANSVELRVPLLDHKILEFAASLPPKLKVRGLTTKFLLKKALATRVPREILDRPKTGFPVPYESWLANDLRNWAREILLDRRTIDRGYFDPQRLERLLSAQSVETTYAKEVFSLVTLELWHRAFT